MNTAALLVVSLLAQPQPYVDDKVFLEADKTTWLGGVKKGDRMEEAVRTDGYKIITANCTRESFISGREALIAPGTYDPGFTQALISPADSGCNGIDSSGYAFRYHVYPRSLRDIGSHIYKCTFGYASLGSTCSPCWSSCLALNVTRKIEYYIVNYVPLADPKTSPASPAWNSFVTFQANSLDYDGGPIVHRWSLISRPERATANLSNPSIATPTLSLGSENDIGTWKFVLNVDDDEGETLGYPIEFTVPNVLPNFEISDPADVVVNNPIVLRSTKTTDEDGGNLTFVWDILQTPEYSSQRAQNNYSTASSITIPTTRTDLGTWVFRLTATDNERESVTKTVTVNVVNLKPRIVFSGPSEIDAGQNLLLSTTALQDDDGGALSFKWEVVQQPNGAGSTSLPYVLSTGPTASLSSTSSKYGTWIFRLTATDDEGEAVQKEFKVLIDAGPWVYTSGVSGEGYSDPLDPMVINRGDYLLLYGWTDDPDSPCTDSANRCHRTDGRPVSISPGIVRYEWSIIMLPDGVNYDLAYYEEGPVHNSFYGVADDGRDLNFGFAEMPEGLWGFELRVWDAEGNDTSYPIFVEVQQQSAPPQATFWSTVPYYSARVTTPLSGVLPQDLSFDASYSYDPDNEIPYESGEDLGLGITNYKWEAIPPTPQCSVPALPDDYDGVVATLYRAGTIIPPECQGRWRMRLTVTDDDQVRMSSIHEASFSIGNCGGKVCLDAPRQSNPALISTQAGGGVFIGYHIDSALYDETVFGSGVRTKLEILLEDNTLSPIYSAVSGPATQTSRGRMIVHYWNGLTQSGGRVPEGKYFHVKVSLLDASSNLLGSQMESRAIKSEPLQAVINEPSTKYVQSYRTGTVSFTITGALSPVDYYRGRVLDEQGNVVATFTASASATSMPINGNFPAGRYTFELAAIRGSTAFTVATHPLVIYQYQLEPLWLGGYMTEYPLLANNDDDNLNGVKDSAEFLSDAVDDELVPLKVTLLPRLDGTLKIEHTFGDGTFRFWETGFKTGELTFPKTWILPGGSHPGVLYVEPLEEARGEIRLSFTLADGTPLAVHGVTLSAVMLEAMKDVDGNHLIDDADADLDVLKLGSWDDAYTLQTYQDSNGKDVHVATLINGLDPDNFVERESARFYLRAQGAFLDRDPSKADTFSLRADFMNSSPYSDSTWDGSNFPIKLVENGVHTSALVSRSHMVTGRDIEGIPLTDTDDGHPVHNGVSAVAADGADGDRTWRSSIDNHLRLLPLNIGISQSWRIPICGPERRKVPLRIHIFMEPFNDVGLDPDGNPSTPDTFGDDNKKFDWVDANGNGQHDLGERSEPYLDVSKGAELAGVARSGDDPLTLSARGPVTSRETVLRDLRQTDSLWSPACIKTEVVGPILFEEAPFYNKINILMDGKIKMGETATIYSAHQELMEDESQWGVIEVFYGVNMESSKADAIALGKAYPPHYQDLVEQDEKLFTVIASNWTDYNVLPHELAHLLANAPDSDVKNPTFFFPTDSARKIDTVTNGRRMPWWVRNQSRTVRPEGDLMAPGNRVLQPY